MSTKMNYDVEDKDLACSPGPSPADKKIYLHSVIGIALMVLFWVIPPIEPITPIGMRLAGCFLGMIYLWSMVGTLWPSLLGLFLIAMSGYAGPGPMGFKTTIMEAFGADTVQLTLFAMVLFGCMDEVGGTKYIARWFLTRKVITGRPYVFMAIFYLTCFALSALTSPITSLILLWPIALRLMDGMRIERCDQIWPYFFVGMFFVSTIGQPFFPFLGAQLVVVSAFEKMTAGAILVPYLSYMALNFIMCLILTTFYLIILKFVIRPDVSKLRDIDADAVAQEQQLPPMNMQQTAMLGMIPLYIIMLLIPSFLPPTVPGVTILKTMGPLGVTLFWIILFSLIRFKGDSVLNFKEVAYSQFNWGIYFMIAAAVYTANAISTDASGVKPFLIQTLNPILGGRSETAFVAILFTVALILTNFANNAAMAVVLMPVALAFCEQMGLAPLPVCMGITMMVFVAMLTPAASPHAGMMWGRRDIYTAGDILKIGLPLCFVTLVFYIFVGYPLAKMMF